jgi:hypothetical protein
MCICVMANSNPRLCVKLAGEAALEDEERSRRNPAHAIPRVIPVIGFAHTILRHEIPQVHEIRKW